MCVYFIAEPPPDGFVKIGYGDVQRRLHAHQISNARPLTVIGIMDNRTCREWLFRTCPSLFDDVVHRAEVRAELLERLGIVDRAPDRDGFNYARLAERRLHALFDGARQNGEWFTPTPALRAFVEEWAAV
jgi:hypothetical protein